MVLNPLLSAGSDRSTPCKEGEDGQLLERLGRRMSGRQTACVRRPVGLRLMSAYGVHSANVITRYEACLAATSGVDFRTSSSLWLLGKLELSAEKCNGRHVAHGLAGSAQCGSLTTVATTSRPHHNGK